MEQALWYLFVGTRGGETRVEIVRALSDRPKNANQLAAELEYSYNTVRYHLDQLADHDVVTEGDAEYGTLYFLTDRFEQYRDVFDRIATEVT